MTATPLAQWGNDLYTGNRSYDIVGKRRRWYTATMVFALASVVLLLVNGLTPSIDFRGGSEFTVAGVSDTTQQIGVDAVLSVAPMESPRVTVVGSSAMRVQTGEMDADTVRTVAAALADAYEVPVEQVSSTAVGPTWGASVTSKALNGLVIFLLLAMVFMAVYFRTWRMSTAAVASLGLDLLLTVGIYAALGWEVSPATVIGLLTILSYSIYDTVVVFDKVRENTANVLAQHRFTYAELVNLAVNQTLVRSLNTSIVALLPVGGILFIGALLLGAGTLRDIALALFVGMAVGTVLSVFFAAPFQVTLREREDAIAQHTKEVLDARVAGPTTDDGRTPVQVRPLVAGTHLGQKAQPRRRKGGRR